MVKIEFGIDKRVKTSGGVLRVKKLDTPIFNEVCVLIRHSERIMNMIPSFGKDRICFKKLPTGTCIRCCSRYK